MAEILSFEDAVLGRNILGLYTDNLVGINEEEREYVEKAILKTLIPKVIKRLRDENLPTNFDDLREKVEFYNLLFDELCKHLISDSSYIRNVSDEFKSGVLKYLYDRREMDKERLLYDEDFYDELPMVSDYEFDIPAIMNDIVTYLNRAMEDSQVSVRR